MENQDLDVNYIEPESPNEKMAADLKELTKKEYSAEDLQVLERGNPELYKKFQEIVKKGSENEYKSVEEAIKSLDAFLQKEKLSDLNSPESIKRFLDQMKVLGWVVPAGFYAFLLKNDKEFIKTVQKMYTHARSPSSSLLYAKYNELIDKFYEPRDYAIQMFQNRLNTIGQFSTDINGKPAKVAFAYPKEFKVWFHEKHNDIEKKALAISQREYLMPTVANGYVKIMRDNYKIWKDQNVTSPSKSSTDTAKNSVSDVSDAGSPGATDETGAEGSGAGASKLPKFTDGVIESGPSAEAAPEKSDLSKHGEGTFDVKLIGKDDLTVRIEDLVADPVKTPIAKSNNPRFSGGTHIWNPEKKSYFDEKGTRLQIRNGDKITLAKDDRSESEKKDYEAKLAKEKILGEFRLAESDTGYAIVNKAGKTDWSLDSADLKKFDSMKNVTQIENSVDGKPVTYTWKDGDKPGFYNGEVKLIFKAGGLTTFHTVKAQEIKPVGEVKEKKDQELVTSDKNKDLIRRLNEYSAHPTAEWEMYGIRRDDLQAEIWAALESNALSPKDKQTLQEYKLSLAVAEGKKDEKGGEDSDRAKHLSEKWKEAFISADSIASKKGVELKVESYGMHENNKVLSLTKDGKTEKIRVAIPILGKVENYDKASGVAINWVGEGKKFDNVPAAVDAVIAKMLEAVAEGAKKDK